MPMYGLTGPLPSVEPGSDGSSIGFDRLMSEYNRANRLYQSESVNPATKVKLQARMSSLMAQLESKAQVAPEKPGFLGRVGMGGLSALDKLTLPIQLGGDIISRNLYNASVLGIKAIHATTGLEPRRGGDVDDLSFVSPISLDRNEWGAGRRIQQMEDELGRTGGNDALTRVNLPGERFDFDITRNRLAGGYIDVVTDPTTLIGGTSIVAKGAGAAGRAVTVARRANRSLQLDTLMAHNRTVGAAAQVRRGLGDVSTADLAAAGIDRRLNVRVLGDAKIPGSAPLVQGAQKVTGALSRGVRDNPVAKAISGLVPEGSRATRTRRAFDAARRLTDGDISETEFLMETKALARQSDFVTARSNEAGKLEGSFLKKVKAAGGKKLERQWVAASDEVIDFIENPLLMEAAVRKSVAEFGESGPYMMTTAAGESLDVRPFVDFLSETHDQLASVSTRELLGVKGSVMGLTGQQADQVFGYFPRVMDSGEFSPYASLSGGLEHSQRGRTFVPGETIGNIALVDEGTRLGLPYETGTVSRAQVREAFAKATTRGEAVDPLPWTGNLLEQIEGYITSIGSYRGSLKVANRVVDEGLGMKLSDHGPFLLRPDSSMRSIYEGLGNMHAFRRGDAKGVQQVLEYTTNNLDDIVKYPRRYAMWLAEAKVDVVQRLGGDPKLLALYDEAAANLKLMMRAQDGKSLYPDPVAGGGNAFSRELARTPRAMPATVQAGGGNAFSRELAGAGGPATVQFFAVQARDASLRAMIRKVSPAGGGSLDDKAMRAILKKLRDPKQARTFEGQITDDVYMQGLTDLVIRNTDLDTVALNQKVLVTERVANAMLTPKPEEWGKVLSMMETQINWWKRSATTTPAFNVRNMFGGIVNELSAGHTLPEIRRNQKIIADFLIDGTLPSDPRVRRIMEEIVDRGDFRVLARNKFGETAGQVTSTFQKGQRHSFRRGREAASVKFDSFGARVGQAALGVNPLRGLRGADESLSVEALLRGGHLISRMQRGLDYDAARRSMFEFHFDYADLSKVDQVARLIMPFWTFRSRNIPLQSHLLIHKPGLYGDIARYERSTRDDSKLQPDYYDEYLSLGGGLGDGSIRFTPDIPLNDLIQLTSEARRGLEGGVGGTVEAGISVVLNDSSPIIKIATGIAGQRDVFTGAPLDDPNYELEIPNFPFTQGDDKYANMLAKVLIGNGFIFRSAEDGTIRTHQRWVYALNQFAPLWGRMAKLSRDEEETDKSFVKLVNLVFGGVRLHGDRQRLNAAYDIREDQELMMEEFELYGG